MFLELLFLKSYYVMSGGPLVSIVPFTMLFYGAHFSFYYQHGRPMERATIIESSLSMK